MTLTSESVDRFADKWLVNDPVYLTAMARCKPSSALAADASHRKWRVLEYRSEQLSGTAIVAGNETEAPPVRLPLEVRGWHAVSIGAWRLKDWYLHGGEPPELLVRLTGDKTFSILHLPTRPPPSDPVGDWPWWTGGEELSECFWKISDLSGGRTWSRWPTSDLSGARSGAWVTWTRSRRGRTPVSRHSRRRPHPCRPWEDGTAATSRRRDAGTSEPFRVLLAA